MLSGVFLKLPRSNRGCKRIRGVCGLIGLNGGTSYAMLSHGFRMKNIIVQLFYHVLRNHDDHLTKRLQFWYAYVSLNMNLYYSDFIIPQQKWHSTSASLQMDLIVDLHHYVMFYLILIMVVVLITLGNALVLSKPPYAFGRQIREFLVEEWFDKYDMDMILYTSYDLQCLRFMYRSAFPSRENVVESLERWFKFEPLGLFLPWNWFFGQAELIYNFEQDYDHIIIFLNLEIPLDWPIFYRIDDIP